MTDDQMRSLFREMREEPVPADSLTRVRIGVAQRQEKPRVWLWLIPVLMAAATLLALVFFRPERPVPLPAPPLIAVNQVPPAPAVTPTPPIRRAVHHPRPRVQSRPGTIMRIETNDPSVVILLVESN
jgi:anti-sigma factor RsiW